VNDAMTILQTARVNRPFANALEADSRYAQAVAMREKALEAQRILPAVKWPPPPLNTDVTLDDWLRRVANARAAEQVREAQLTALRGLVRDCDGQIVGCALVDPNRLLRRLAAEFNALMTELESVVARLGGAKSAAEAVDVGNDAVTGWRGLAARGTATTSYAPRRTSSCEMSMSCCRIRDRATSTSAKSLPTRWPAIWPSATWMKCSPTGGSPIPGSRWLVSLRIGARGRKTLSHS
jgi:hypothetical protein